MNLYEYMEDFDNQELDPYDWESQMIDAVLDYNQEYDTEHLPDRAIKQYKSWKKDKNPLLNEY
jgi:hypothetical protein